ncbi:low molecular weight phosphotyrosine protein phosphatase [Phytoactinopolyspora alkaliphila]|uniref:protein-tyrosine-phosphatase n=1 Tax=Phytoactinopolyspora alkaliphila TaxID=1783498 RepID=A0A6N9YUH1_9ACTN|nr:low molecular weight protein-tyrosine-phosphatase [Phytoactinopolyspora alkaliphila]NED98458.1 low molecular weight phosphotyrosine protein phosphatase [Phytoactinopolyspora alkaliphila]
MTSFQVCLVCAGNICRSPIAEVVFRRRLADAGLDQLVTVESAGTGGWHEGEPADPRAVRTLSANGYDGSQHCARQFQPAWFERYDLVLALDSANVADLERIAPDAEARRKIRMLGSYVPGRDGAAMERYDVPDPYYGGDDGFDHVLRLVEAAATGFVDDMRSRLGS